MSIMNVNTNTYVIAVDNTNKSATLTPQDTNQSKLIIYNGSTTAAFVVSGKTAPTAVFPTSATVPLQGKVVGPGAIVTFSKNTDHGFISAIQATSGTGNLYISPGSGE
jgi:hypothetical protein